jgi:hypothetical protein
MNNPTPPPPASAKRLLAARTAGRHEHWREVMEIVQKARQRRMEHRQLLR